MVSGVGHRAVYFNQFYCWIKKQNHQTRKTACVTYECTIITACQRSCGKEMFSQVSVCSRGEGGYSGPMSLFGVGGTSCGGYPPSPTPQDMGLHGWVCPPPPHLNMGYNVIRLASEQNASYWNAFLFICTSMWINFCSVFERFQYFIS